MSNVCGNSTETGANNSFQPFLYGRMHYCTRCIVCGMCANIYRKCSVLPNRKYAKPSITKIQVKFHWKQEQVSRFVVYYIDIPQHM